ncbi:Hypothetical protein FKW44_005150 [Caligus rogercresseyi]|uniref:Uncharacterized protein n=1 Tax=Caligus rogercresseyi TaxID=217165 RepID=A0A7T8KBJ3_CALRO|nr:Hypothetical protein FKW44_005150 [Caligus rogercresseyi]
MSVRTKACAKRIREKIRRNPARSLTRWQRGKYERGVDEKSSEKGSGDDSI